MKSHRPARGFLLVFIIVMLAVLTISLTVLSRAMFSRTSASRQHYAREEAVRRAERVLEQARQKLQSVTLKPEDIIDRLHVKFSVNGDVTVLETLVAVFETEQRSASSMVRAVRVRWNLAMPSAIRTGWQADDLALKPGDPLLAP